jgi:hypothetical protein
MDMWVEITGIANNCATVITFRERFKHMFMSYKLVLGHSQGFPHFVSSKSA